VSLAPPPLNAWRDMPPVWARWFQALFARVGGSAIGGDTDVSLPQLVSDLAPIASPASGAPAMDGTAAVGVSARYARADHVHPTDTSRAPLASPALTGTPTAPTPAVGDDSTQIATTAFLAAALPRATVDVTAGDPGSVAIVGNASGISGVSIESLTAPVNPYRVVRFTFATAMPDTDYVVVPPAHEFTAGVNATAMLGRSFVVITKATTHFEIGMGNTVPTYTHVGEYTHRFSVLVYR
jgi:hypothetical protein